MKQREPTPDATQDRLWPYLLAIALIPAVVLWHQDNMFFPRPGLIDGWVYHGLFRNLVNFKQSLFPGLYYGSRLAWILPGAAAHALFPPVAAYYVLHLLIHYVATFSFFAILRCFTGIRAAFLATLVFAANPLLWNAIQSDYINGAGIAYCLLTLALLTRAAMQPARRWPLLVSGAALGALIYTNLFWISLTPLLLAYYAALRWIWNRDSLAETCVPLGVWMGSGFAILTLAFGAINYRIDGNFWFYAPSIRFLRALNLEKNPWFAGISAPAGLWPWLWVSLLATAAALYLFAILIRRKSSARDQASGILPALWLLVLAFMVYLQARGTPVLGNVVYACYLVPFEFLVIGIAFWSAVDKLKPGTYAWICIVTAAIFSAIWYDYAGLYTPMWPVAIPVTSWACVFVFAFAIILRQRIAGTLLALAGCAILTAEVRFQPPEYPLGVHDRKPNGPHDYKHDYQRIMNARHQIENVRNGNPIHFWYTDSDAAFPDFRTLASTYHYAYSWLGENSAQHACDAPPEPGNLVVVLSSDGESPQLARDTLAACWGKFAMLPEALSKSAFVSFDGAPWDMTVIRATADSSVRHQLSALFNSQGDGALQFDLSTAATLPLDRWKAYVDKNEHATIRQVGDRVELQTPEGQHAWGAMYAPLIAPVTGRYRFALQYRPVSGHFAFGAYAGDSSHWLGVVTEGHAVAGGMFEMSLWLNLQQGERILPRIENDDLTGNHVASFVMQCMTAFEIDPH